MTETSEVKVEVLALTDGAGALSAVDKAAIDMQIATAKTYPRSVSAALKEATTLATLDEETAESMFYSLPRGKNDDGTQKFIEGPSARLAEIMAYTWGNLRVDADIVAEDKTTVTAMGTCFDLEKNVAIRVRVKRRITDSRGRRYNDDMIGVTSNAAISIALRNCVFKVVPRTFVDRIYGAARKASLGEAGTFTAKRAKALAWFAKAGVKAEQLYAFLNVKGLDDIGEDQYITLRGLSNAIKEGEVSIEQTFRPTDKSDGASQLNEAVKKEAAPAPTPAAATPVSTPETDAERATRLAEDAAIAAADRAGHR